MASILAVHGLANQSPEFLRKLYSLAERNGWSVDGIAALISEESGFNPQAKSPTSSAVGLLQWIKSTAQSLGTSTAELLSMTAIQQLDVVERFFQKYVGSRQLSDEDVILVGWGRTDLIGKSDSVVVEEKNSSDPGEALRYAANASLDRGGKGYITVGDIRAPLRRTLANAGGRRIEVPGGGISPGKTRAIGGAALALALIGLGALAWTSRRAA